MEDIKTQTIDVATINSLNNGSWFSSGGINVSYNEYFAQISIILYFNVTLAAGAVYSFKVPDETIWSKAHVEKIAITPIGNRVLIAVNADNTITISPNTQIAVGDNIREEFFCFRK